MRASLLLTAWKKLILTYLMAYAISLLAGITLLALLDISPEAVFQVSTKRVSYALPVMEMGTKAGIDGGVLLFIWNTVGALATISFIYTAALFNPLHSGRPPRFIRRMFCSPVRMKLFCFLPGCLKIEAESLRRLYVWLMVPFIGMILLGIETGLSASTAKNLFGSYQVGILSLLPHGIIEIPAFALAGAVTFSGHLLVKPKAVGNGVEEIFQALNVYRSKLPIKTVLLCVVLSLLVAGWLEAHVTPELLNAW